MREYCFVKDTFFIELETGSALHKKIAVLLADHPCDIHRLCVQSSSANEVFCKE